MDTFIEFVKNWGYWAVFLGATVEGESVILTASSMARFGYLDIYKIMIIAFLTTTFVDQILFFVGRHFGPAIFQRHPKLKPGADRAFKYLHRFDIWFILLFRFIYGIRIISPIVIGAGGITPKRFIPLNILSAFIWAVLSCTGGYMLGEVIFEILHDIHAIQKYFLYTMGGIIVLVVYFFWRKRRKNK